MVNENAVAGTHGADSAHRLRIGDAIPCRPALAFEVVDGICVRIGLCQEPGHAYWNVTCRPVETDALRKAESKPCAVKLTGIAELETLSWPGRGIETPPCEMLPLGGRDSRTV